MEGIREQLVKKPVTKPDKIKTYAILLAALLLAIVVVMVFNILFGTTMILIGLLLSGAILYGGYWLTGELSIEYEYCFSGGELIVDKIINQKKRKSMCQIHLRSAESFIKNPKSFPDTTEINACGEEYETYGIVYTDEKYGRSILMFTPDEKMLEMIKPYLPRVI